MQTQKKSVEKRSGESASDVKSTLLGKKEGVNFVYVFPSLLMSFAILPSSLHLERFPMASRQAHRSNCSGIAELQAVLGQRYTLSGFFLHK